MAPGKFTITTEPAQVPADYWSTKEEPRQLAWDYVDQSLADAINYWVSTTWPDGRPHAMPTWAVWVDGRIYFDGSEKTRRLRNLAANPHCVVHLEDGGKPVIIEGSGKALDKPSAELAGKLAAEYARKYRDLGYAPEPTQWNEGGLWEVTPTKALAWTEFGVDMTRWIISE